MKTVNCYQGGESILVQVNYCDCSERIGVEIDSMKLFDEIRVFFQEQVDKDVFIDLTDYSTIWHEHGGTEKEIYRDTTKKYKCRSCGCFWEFCYPEFPASGRVTKCIM